MDDIFMRMNDTFSSAGEEYLYFTLRNNTKSNEELEHLEQVMEAISKLIPGMSYSMEDNDIYIR